MKRLNGLTILARKVMLMLLLLTTPVPAAALQYLPEGCFGQITEDQIVVYYFTRKFRCQSCETLENTLLETVRKQFQLSFTSGKLAMCVINVDNPINRHYLDEFDILSTSVYIVEKREGKIVRSKYLDEIWEVLDDDQAIAQILKSGLSVYMDKTAEPR